MRSLPPLKPRPERQSHLFALRHDPTVIAARQRLIYETLLARSALLQTGNFESIGGDDLKSLLELYNTEFFGGLLTTMVREDSGGEVALRLSSRLTRAAGKTILRRKSVKNPFGGFVRSHYEIAISTLLLFQSFDGGNRSVTIGGIICRDRLEALQRIFEHELIHLAEFLAWGKSSCSAANFKNLSGQIFGHVGVHHDLITPREVAAEKHGVRTGDLVYFEIDGRKVSGRVNRITKRATVLQEDPTGRLFSDGRRYLTFYVPLALLNKAENGS